MFSTTDHSLLEKAAAHLLICLLKIFSAILLFGVQEACLGTLSFMEAHRLVEMALGYVFAKVSRQDTCKTDEIMHLRLRRLKHLNLR